MHELGIAPRTKAAPQLSKTTAHEDALVEEQISGLRVMRWGLQTVLQTVCCCGDADWMGGEDSCDASGFWNP